MISINFLKEEKGYTINRSSEKEVIIMSKALFQAQVEKNFERLDLYTTAITRAHGKSHPEAFDVRKVFEKIQEKVKAAGEGKPDLCEEFAQLQKVTDYYAIPKGVCPTYESTYEMLKDLNQAYDAQ